MYPYPLSCTYCSNCGDITKDSKLIVSFGRSNAEPSKMLEEILQLLERWVLLHSTLKYRFRKG